MQPVGPYQFIETLGLCQVGRVWAAVDGQGRPLKVAVLDGAAAADQRWREAFAGAANAMAQPWSGDIGYVQADFSAATPWAAYAADGSGAERLFQILGMDLQPAVPQSRPAAVSRDEPTAATREEPAVTQMLPVVEPSPANAAPAGNPGELLGDPSVAGSAEHGAPVEPAQPLQPAPTSNAPNVPDTAQPVPWESGAPTAPDPTQVPLDLPWAPQSVSAAQPGSDVPQSFVAGPTPPTSETTHDPFASPAPQVNKQAELPQRGQRPRTGLLIGIGALALLVLAGSGIVLASAVKGKDTPRSGPALYSEERALAIASPSLVYLETIITGYLRDRKTKATIRTAAITFNRRCSGFMVNPNGHVVTSTSCVKPTEKSVRRIALYALSRMLVREGKLDSKKVDDYVKANLGKTLFTGTDPNSEPAGRLYGQLNVGRGNLTDDSAIPGELVKTLPAEAGGLAVIKLAQHDLPVAELAASSTLKPGTSVLAVGYSTNDADFRSATYTLRSRSVTVTSVGRRGSASIYRINDDVGATSHGGMVIDTGGRVVGMLNHDNARPDRANRVVVPVSTITELLKVAGITNTLGESDKLYRSGLDAYFAGSYSSAKSQLDRVAKPTNLVASKYRQNAAERQRNEGEQLSLPVWVISLLGGLGGAMMAGLIVLMVVLVRRAKGREPGAVPQGPSSGWPG